jgi:catechol 2,3-dioxygenase-like lactoylglutathione lyase family enzyme
MGFAIDHLDHLVLTVANIDTTVAFYTSAVGMELVTFDGRKALRFGEQKINLHQAGNEFEPKSGSSYARLCGPVLYHENLA